MTARPPTTQQPVDAALVLIRSALNLGPTPPSATDEQMEVMEDAWRATNDIWNIVYALRTRAGLADNLAHALRDLLDEAPVPPWFRANTPRYVTARIAAQSELAAYDAATKETT